MAEIMSEIDTKNSVHFRDYFFLIGTLFEKDFSLFFRFYEEESELIEAHILEHVFYGYIISKFFDCNKSQPQLTPKVYQH